ncbi:MAG: hypothetical protein GEV05_29100 [Betaproteobacteria bacterium]|nr:hypothetical protein [Betaproteobacteria bacterium]
MVVTPSGKALGADISGIDLANPVDDHSLRRIIEAWHDHLVLRFRSQDISEAAFVRFGKVSG